MHPRFVIRVLLSAFWSDGGYKRVPHRGRGGRESLRTHPRTSRETQGYVIIITLKKKKGRESMRTHQVPQGESRGDVFFLINLDIFKISM